VVIVPSESLQPRAPQPPRKKTIRTVLADDHIVMRRRLRAVLDAAAAIEVVAEAAELTAVTQIVRELTPDVLAIDLSMSNGTSFDTIRGLRTAVAGTEIVVLTMEESAVFATQALRAGAIGFVLKQTADAELVQAVSLASQGAQYVSQRVRGLPSSARGPHSGDALSPRETDVLRLIALGHTSGDIGRKMRLSAVSVKSARAGIRHKLGVVTRVEVVRYALRQGLIKA
jgi:two-component system response regulator NreC